VNQWLKSRKRGAGSNLVDRGRCAVRDLCREVRSTPKPVDGVGGEATVKDCGVGVAMLPGQSWVTLYRSRTSRVRLTCRLGKDQIRHDPRSCVFDSSI
jgi:hypothetical protein